MLKNASQSRTTYKLCDQPKFNTYEKLNILSLIYNILANPQFSRKYALKTMLWKLKLARIHPSIKKEIATPFMTKYILVLKDKNQEMDLYQTQFFFKKIISLQAEKLSHMTGQTYHFSKAHTGNI